MSGTYVRLAKLGYFATAPELFAREGDVNTMTDLQTILDTVTAKILGSQVATDIDSAIARATATKKADVERLGITGFCWGGRQVALRGGQSRRQGGVVWYGGPLAGHRPTPATRRSANGTASTARRIRSTWSPTSGCRSSGFTAGPTPASRSPRSNACARR
jgi:dienelactone hydrolase